MKTSTTLLIAGVALALTGPAFAGRDQSQLVQQERAARAVQAQRLAQAQQGRQGQQGLAGATGVPGKAGPSGQPTQVNKLRPPRL